MHGPRDLCASAAAFCPIDPFLPLCSARPTFPHFLIEIPPAMPEDWRSSTDTMWEYSGAESRMAGFPSP